MSRRITTEDWVCLAKEQWGDAYDYSAVCYSTAKTPVKVICPRHGPWFPLPCNHVRAKQARGCPACGGGVAKPFASFLSEANALHQGRYRYDADTYAGAIRKMRIWCTDHGAFWQAPTVHLRGSGCSGCSAEKASRSSREEYGTEAARRIYERSNGLVVLDHSTYRGINQKADFGCAVHGRFTRLVNTALNASHPCPRCGVGTRQPRATSSVEQQVRERWPHYSLLPFEHRGKTTRLQLKCPQHGGFSLLVGSVYRSPGCPRCSAKETQPRRTAGLRRRNQSTLERRAAQWLQSAREIHDGRYDYSKVRYVSARQYVEIGCPRHGFFSQPPMTHLKAGCRRCADDELKGLYSERYFERNLSEAGAKGFIYYVQMTHGDHVFFKVGITRSTLVKRFGMLSSGGVRLQPISVRETTLLEAFRAEQAILQEHVRYCPFDPRSIGLSARALRMGASECFSDKLSRAEHLKLVGLGS